MLKKHIKPGVYVEEISKPASSPLSGSSQDLIVKVEEYCNRALKAFAFEPNDAPTWTKVRGTIEDYLIPLWRQGSLQGATTREAFFVRASLGDTMTAADVAEGRLIVDVGLAAIRPAEFIVVRFTQGLHSSV